MTSAQIVKKLKATSSRLDKEKILKETWDSGNTEFFEGVQLCFDGLVSFGVKQVPEKLIDSPNMKMTFQDFIGLANKLRKRELTGHAARDAINDFIDGCDQTEWNNFYRLILIKDMDCGISESTTNKVLEKIGGKALNYVVEEFPYQRCCLPKHTNLDEFSWHLGVLSQKKADGMFANVNLNADGSVDMLSRAGKAFPLDEFKDLVADIEKTFTKNTQSHGELLVFRDGKELPREIGNGILNSVAQGGKFESTDKPIYVVWDNIPLSSVCKKGTHDVMYVERFDGISKQLKAAKPKNIQIVETKVVHSYKEALEHYQEMLALGYEGTIIKEPTAPWKDGTSKLQVKLKLDVEVDLEIVGFRAGNGKNADTFGSIEVKTSDGLLEVGVSGFKDKKQPGVLTRAEINEMKEQLIGTIMTVVSNGIMKPTGNNEKYSLFLPRFKEFRKDKLVADDLQKVKDLFDAAIKK